MVLLLFVNAGGACCSLFGDTTLYDGVTIAGLVLPTPSTTATKDRRPVTGAIYEQPDVEATIRWPAPPLFTLEDEQRQSNQPMMVRVKQVKETTNNVSTPVVHLLIEVLDWKERPTTRQWNATMVFDLSHGLSDIILGIEIFPAWPDLRSILVRPHEILFISN